VATFIQTTLTKRTGATTTVFEPNVMDSGTAYWHTSGTLAGFGRYLEASQSRGSSARRTRVRVGIPQLDSNGEKVLYRPSGLIELYIPDGTAQDDVNDLVGYINALTASGMANFNDILVDGVGVY
jgi:hypothetical protein